MPLLEQLQICAVLNKQLGTHVLPWELDQWPMDLIEVAIGWANGGKFEASADDEEGED